jgi:hypothetical protein
MYSKLLCTIATLTALITLTISNPITPRWMDGVYICSDANWQGDCNWYGPDKTACFGLPSDSQHISFGPDPMTVCTLYTDRSCEKSEGVGTGSKSVMYPGGDNMPGPAYQGGAGTAPSPAYKAWMCYGKGALGHGVVLDKQVDDDKVDEPKLDDDKVDEDKMDEDCATIFCDVKGRT